MTAPEVRVLPDADALASSVADAFLEVLRGLQAEGVVPRVVLGGGGILESVHRNVATSTATGVDWSRVEFWFGDERYVESFSADRNSLTALREFLEPVGASPGLIHVPPASDSGLPLADAVATYAQEFPTEDFDLVMLGIGPDGHTASLFPGHPAALADADAAGVINSPKPPPLRLSMTIRRLSRSAEVWLIASGASKADAVASALATGSDPSQVPAAGPRGRGRTLWWLDAAATHR